MSQADTNPSISAYSTQQILFFILITGLLANAIGQAFIFAILPPLGREVALSEVQTTSIISTSALVFTFCSPWWGRRSDQIGRKIIIVIGLTGYAVGTVIFAGVFALGMKGILSGWTLYSPHYSFGACSRRLWLLQALALLPTPQITVPAPSGRRRWLDWEQPIA